MVERKDYLIFNQEKILPTNDMWKFSLKFG